MFKCIWHWQIGQHTMLSIHNHLDKPFFYRVRSCGDVMLGIGGFQIHYHKFPIEWAK